MTLQKQTWNEYETILRSLKDDILVTNTNGVILNVSEVTGSIRCKDRTAYWEIGISP
ncbi:hypothetical protein [Neobacillus terrae]|uniref:hypothetical protein n=1 Tax=Neobacillus terrae TaxID=3034837 RepID=UPI00140AE4B5|nr:hypothetical protein [Neobacillus terrae]NHM32447.1 hypothetical protein [Neobacillus terrae]